MEENSTSRGSRVFKGGGVPKKLPLIDRVMLDNMSITQIREAISKIKTQNSNIKIEVSGGVNLDTVREIANTGVDYISVGALTHSAPAIDMSLIVKNGS